MPLVAEFQGGLERLATRSHEVSLGGTGRIMRSTKESLFSGWVGVIWHQLRGLNPSFPQVVHTRNLQTDSLLDVYCTRMMCFLIYIYIHMHICICIALYCHLLGIFGIRPFLLF